MAKIMNLYIQDDNIEPLSHVDNKARLINDLMREHFRKIDPNLLTPEEIRKEIAKRKAEKEYRDKMEEIKNGQF